MPRFRIAAIAALCILVFASAAQAETRIFTVDGSDGYGIDRCLAAGEQCGAAAANALCRSRDFAEAVTFGRLDPTEITGGVPQGIRVAHCEGRSCPQTVAITCVR